MKLSEVKYNSPDWLAMDENKFACRGFALASFGFDLERLPDRIMEPCIYVPTSDYSTRKVLTKVYVRDIVGTTYKDYGGDTWLAAFLKVHRLDNYIKRGDLSKKKYLRMLHRIDAEHPSSMVELALTPQGLVVDANGNHRVSTYKMMYISELESDEYGISEKAYKRYWLWAWVNVPSGYDDFVEKTSAKLGYKFSFVGNFLKRVPVI